MKINKDLKFPVSIHDSIMQEITFGSLITAINCNEIYKNEQTVKRVFYELLEQQVLEAKQTLNSNIDFILANLEE